VRFEKYLYESLEAIAENQPIDHDLFETRLKAYLDLLRRGYEPERARRIMTVYMEAA